VHGAQTCYVSIGCRIQQLSRLEFSKKNTRCIISTSSRMFGNFLSILFPRRNGAPEKSSLRCGCRRLPRTYYGYGRIPVVRILMPLLPDTWRIRFALNRVRTVQRDNATSSWAVRTRFMIFIRLFPSGFFFFFSFTIIYNVLLTNVRRYRILLVLL
jgi:hypothetical protein